jgi:prepilin-type N-terminal cleavage/methylation domain-containing protein
MDPRRIKCREEILNLKTGSFKNGNRPGSKGFTLPEIAFVIVIIGILITIAIVRYLDMSQASKRAACFENQAVLEEAQTLYYTSRVIQTGAGGYAASLDDLIPFLQSETLPVCPEGYDYILLPQGAVDCEDPDHHRTK